MELMNIEMPKISHCDVIDCAYNVNMGCHAKAITIGDAKHPACDTYLNISIHCQNAAQTAGVGACKVTSCKFNHDLECNAQNISVGFVGKSVECLTFSKI